MPNDEVTKLPPTGRNYQDSLLGTVLIPFHPSIKSQIADTAIKKPKATVKIDSHGQSEPLGLLTLPTELLLEILKYSPNFVCLYNFLITLPTGYGILETFGTDIVHAVYQRSRQSQVSEQIHMVMNLRMRPTLPFSHFGCLVDQILGSCNLEAHLRDFRSLFTNPAPIIRDVSEVSDGIDVLVQSFARSRIAVPSQELDGPISPIELCRIRRAFWRFQICYDLSTSRTKWPALIRPKISPPESPSFPRFVWYQNSGCGPGPNSSESWLNSGNGKAREFKVDEFIRTLSIWEIVEFEAVRFHLACVLNSLQYQSSTTGSDHVHEQPVLIQQLMHDLRTWNLDGTKEKDHILVADLRIVSPRAQVQKYWDENGSANFANADVTQRSRIWTKYHDQDEHWGWRMWDVERLDRCGLLLETGPKAILAKAECDAARDTSIYDWVTNKSKREAEVREMIRKEEDRKEKIVADERRAMREIQILKGFMKFRDRETFELWIASCKQLAKHPDDEEAERAAIHCHELAKKMKKAEGEQSSQKLRTRKASFYPIHRISLEA